MGLQVDGGSMNFSYPFCKIFLRSGRYCDHVCRGRVGWRDTAIGACKACIILLTLR